MTRAPKLSAIEAWAAQMRAEAADTRLAHDPAFVARLLPWMRGFGRYFDAEVRDADRFLHRQGPQLLVGNHSGGVLTPDTTALLTAWYDARGVDDPLVGLGFDAAFAIPGFGTVMRRLGLVPASQANALAALEAGHSVFVYPGGAHEVFRPWTDRNRIDFNRRRGFVRLALRAGVPVVPVVGHGGHDTTIVVARGSSLARRLRYQRLRLDVAPLLFQLPWGLSSPAFVGVPLPAKITLQVCEPLDWHERYGPEAADDPAVLDACYHEITTLMQGELDRLAAANPWPVATRLRRLLRR